MEAPVSEYPVLRVLVPFASEHDGSGRHNGAVSRSRGLCCVTSSRATSAAVAGRGGRGLPSQLRWTVYSVLQGRTHSLRPLRTSRPHRLFLRSTVCLFFSWGGGELMGPPLSDMSYSRGSAGLWTGPPTCVSDYQVFCPRLACFRNFIIFGSLKMGTPKLDQIHQLPVVASSVEASSPRSPPLPASDVGLPRTLLLVPPSWNVLLSLLHLVKTSV